MPIEVGLDVTQGVKARGRGIARYIRHVTPPLLDAGIAPTLFIRGHRWFTRSLVRDMAPDAQRRWMLLASRLRPRGIELFHSFGNHLPRKGAVPLSMTVHDVRALDQAAEHEGRERLLRNLSRATGLICLTQYGRTRLLKNCPELHEKPISVVPHGVDHSRFKPQQEADIAKVLRRHGLTRPYVLQLGSWFPHKNLELSIRSLARSRTGQSGMRLVFAGGGAPAEYRMALEKLVSQSGLSQRVIWLQHVPGEDLPGLLAGASALLQPSRYEGFALPILEAMAVGIPGVVSDGSCLAEVSSGVWPVAGVDDPAAFADDIDAMVLNEAARSRAIERGLQHAATFTWQRTAQLTAAFFHELVERRGA